MKGVQLGLKALALAPYRSGNTAVLLQTTCLHSSGMDWAQSRTAQHYE